MNKKYRRNKNRFLTGEDIEMIQEREYEKRKKNNVPICDRHIDGA